MTMFYGDSTVFTDDKTAGLPFCTAEGCPKGCTQGGVQ